MNKDTFSSEISKLISGYIEDSIEKEMDFRDNPYHDDCKHENRIALLREYAKHKRYAFGIQQILESELFQYEPEDLEDCFVRKEVAEELYNNIVEVYEELKALAEEESDEDDKKTRMRCCY